MKKYIKSDYDPTVNIEQSDVRYVAKTKGSKAYELDAKDNRKGYTLRRYGGIEFHTLNEAKAACLRYMAEHNIDSDFPKDYFDFYKITYYDNNYYTEEQV